MTTLIIIGSIIYLVIGRIIAEKRWEWDGYDIYGAEIGIILTTLFFPIYLLWYGIKILASFFIDIDL